MRELIDHDGDDWTESAKQQMKEKRHEEKSAILIRAQ